MRRRPDELRLSAHQEGAASPAHAVEAMLGARAEAARRSLSWPVGPLRGPFSFAWSHAGERSGREVAIAASAEFPPSPTPSVAERMGAAVRLALRLAARPSGLVRFATAAARTAAPRLPSAPAAAIPAASLPPIESPWSDPDPVPGRVTVPSRQVLEAALPLIKGDLARLSGIDPKSRHALLLALETLVADIRHPAGLGVLCAPSLAPRSAVLLRRLARRSLASGSPEARFLAAGLLWGTGDGRGHAAFLRRLPPGESDSVALAFPARAAFSVPDGFTVAAAWPAAGGSDPVSVVTTGDVPPGAIRDACAGRAWRMATGDDGFDRPALEAVAAAIGRATEKLLMSDHRSASVAHYAGLEARGLALAGLSIAQDRIVPRLVRALAEHAGPVLVATSDPRVARAAFAVAASADREKDLAFLGAPWSPIRPADVTGPGLPEDAAPSELHASARDAASIRARAALDGALLPPRSLLVVGDAPQSVLDAARRLAGDRPVHRFVAPPVPARTAASLSARAARPLEAFASAEVAAFTIEEAYLLAYGRKALADVSSALPEIVARCSGLEYAILRGRPKDVLVAGDAGATGVMAVRLARTADVPSYEIAGCSWVLAGADAALASGPAEAAELSRRGASVRPFKALPPPLAAANPRRTFRRVLFSAPSCDGAAAAAAVALARAARRQHFRLDVCFGDGEATAAVRDALRRHKGRLHPPEALRSLASFAKVVAAPPSGLLAAAAVSGRRCVAFDPAGSATGLPLPGPAASNAEDLAELVSRAIEGRRVAGPGHAALRAAWLQTAAPAPGHLGRASILMPPTETAPVPAPST